VWLTPHPRDFQPEGEREREIRDASQTFSLIVSNFRFIHKTIALTPKEVKKTFQHVYAPITVYKTLKWLKPSTSVGPDRFSNVFLIQCSSALSVPLSHIFRHLSKTTFSLHAGKRCTS